MTSRLRCSGTVSTALESVSLKFFGWDRAMVI